MKYLLMIVFLFTIIPAFAQTGGSAQVQQFSDKIKQEPDSIKWYINRGDAHLMEGDNAAARADYEKVVALYNANPIGKPAGYVSLAFFKLSELDLQAKKYEPALANIGEALTLKPGEKAYLLHEARVLAATPGKEKEAMQKYDNLVAAYPADEKVLLEYGAWVEPKDPAKAVILYEKVLRANVLNTDALIALGNYFSKAASKISDENLAKAYRNKAIGYLQLLNKVSPQYPGVKEKLIGLLEKAGRNAEANALKGQ